MLNRSVYNDLVATKPK